MSKTIINTDKIKDDLLPLAQKKCSQISVAKSVASSIDFPYDSFNWGNIKEQIEDCANKILKYYNWANNLNSEYVNNISNSIDEINSIEVQEIPKQSLNVK